MGIRFTPNIAPPASPDVLVSSRLRRVNPQPQQFEPFLQAELPFEEFAPGRGARDARATSAVTGEGVATTGEAASNDPAVADATAAFDQLDLSLPGVLIDLIA